VYHAVDKQGEHLEGAAQVVTTVAQEEARVASMVMSMP
jgi:hypothetical protein